MDGKYKNLPWALAKELSQAQGRPSWESSNEGIHERISFDDTIWGFNLAGGAYYDTPLRVTQVKENSRANKAGIKVGDVLRFINDVDTSLLTVQEAHDMILQSGIEIKLKLSAPDVEEPYHYTYEDEILHELKEIKRKRDEESKQKRKPFTGAKTNSEWSCAWPCSKKRDVMYRESNCFLIPSKHEEKMRLKREKKKLEEDREAEHVHKEKIKYMMKTQNAYNIMDSDEEIEPQCIELIHKNKKEMTHLEEGVLNEAEKPKFEIKAELLEALYVADENLETKRDVDEKVNNHKVDNADVIENYIEEEKLFEKQEDSHSECYEQFENNDNFTPAEHDGKIQNYDCEEKGIPDVNEQMTPGDNMNNPFFITGNICKEEFDSGNLEFENEIQVNYEEIDLQNGIKFNEKNETQLSDEEYCIPSDDDDMFHEELVILDESETNILTDENNEDLNNFDELNERNKCQENNETT